MEHLTNEDKSIIGHRIANILQLKDCGTQYRGEVKFKTSWGNKTGMGLYETINRIILEGSSQKDYTLSEND